jgi:hypothetical protein
MKIYSIKKYRNKGRNIKKYKKSRRGCRKRSLIGGKTRRYKVFKNTKRRTLGKRKGRRMVGGTAEALQPWTFEVDPDKLKEYINYEYKTELSREGVTKFSKLNVVAFGDVMITNRSLGYYWRAEHRNERLVVLACYTGENEEKKFVCYAIARCMYECPKKINPGYYEPPNHDMEGKVLFVKPDRSMNKIDIVDIQQKIYGNESDKKISKALDKLSDALDKSRQELEEILAANYKWVEFRSSISSKNDLYRVIMPVLVPGLGDKLNEKTTKYIARQKKLFSFFEALNSNTPFDTPVTYDYPGNIDDEQPLDETGTPSNEEPVRIDSQPNTAGVSAGVSAGNSVGDSILDIFISFGSIFGLFFGLFP